MKEQRILIVEDEECLREVISDVLKQLSYQVDQAGSAKEAIKLLQNNYYSLIISDLLLGDSTGVDIVKYLCEHPQKVPFILMTAFPNSAERNNLNFETLIKPFHIEDLRTMVSSLLQ